MTQRPSYLQQIASRASHDPAPALRPRRFVPATPQAAVEEAPAPARPIAPLPVTMAGVARTIAAPRATDVPPVPVPAVVVEHARPAPLPLRAVTSDAAPAPSPRAEVLVPARVIVRDVVTMVAEPARDEDHAAATEDAVPPVAVPQAARVEPHRLTSRPVAPAPDPLVAALATAVRWTATNDAAPPAPRRHENTPIAEPERARPATVITPAPPPRAEAPRELAPPRAQTPIDRAPRVAPAVHIGTIEIEVISPPAAAPAPAPVPLAAPAPRSTAATTLSRGLTTTLGLRQS